MALFLTPCSAVRLHKELHLAVNTLADRSYAGMTAKQL